MSTWLDNPTNANKLRQSYLKGFLDVSGGGILVRADNSLNFYTTSGLGNDVTKPSFAMDATNIKVKTPGANSLTAVPTTNLSYINDLDENVKAAFADIRLTINGGKKAANTDTAALNVDTDAKIGGNLRVGGNAFFDQSVAVAGNLNIAQNLITKGNGYFGGNLEVAGNEVINMNLYVKGDTFLNGRVFVTQDASFHSNIACYGELQVLGHMVTQQDVSANGRLQVTGAAALKSTLDVTGATALKSSLAVTGATTLTGAATLNNTLAVVGATTMTGALTANGGATLSAVTVSGASNQQGAVTMGSTLAVTDAVTMSSTLAVTGTSTFSDKITIAANGAEITGNSSLHGNVTMDSGKTFTTGDLYFQSGTIGATSNDITIQLQSHKKLHITGDLLVDGSFNFLGAINKTDVNIQVTEQLDISSNGVTPLIVHQNGSTSAYDIAAFNDKDSNPVFIVGKNNAVSVNKSAADNGYALDVSGQSQFSGKMNLLADLSLNGAAKMHGDVTMDAKLTVAGDTDVQKMIIHGITNATGAVTISSGKLTVSSGDTEIQLLKVNGAAQFVQAATFNAGIVLGSTFIDQW